MILIPFKNLPHYLQNDFTTIYYNVLKKRKHHLILKRIFDILVSSIFILLLSPAMIIIAIIIKLSGPGPVFFRQERVTQYYRIFNILKFRTMIENAGNLGPAVTADNDKRITKVGRILRKYRLDELPQVFNIFLGDLSFVGARPEVPKYVNFYTHEMKASLLMPAGVTSAASIMFKDEAKILKDADDIDEIYINKILPQKMEHNLKYIKKFNIFNDIKLMFQTLLAVIKK